jgi:hypothetical protein
VASYIFPAGGQRGKTVDIRVGGLFLYDKCGFEMLGPGVDASKELCRTNTLWLEGPVLPLPDSQRQEDYPQDMSGQVKIAADAPLGHRHWRVWTSQGVTAAKRFVVGDLPEVVEKELPGAPIPVEVTLPVTINGRIFPHEDVDVWSFAARKGQTISCEVEAARLGSPLDSRLEVLDPSGRSIAENDDTFGADSFIRFTAPSDGTYRVRIHDINFHGGQAYVYRLTLTADVRVDRAYPLGGRRGTRAALTLTGQGLPPGSVAVDLPADAPTDYAHRVEVAGKRSNPFRLDVDDLPEHLADEAKTTVPPGQKVDFPAVVNGRISKSGHADHWSVALRKNEVIEFDLKAQRLGSPLSAVLSVLDQDKVLAQADSGPGGRVDPLLSFTAPADGTYTIRVASRFRSAGGPEYAYRLRIGRPATPDFRLRFMPDALTLNRGTQASLKILVERTGGFKEPIALKLEGLPADVTASAVTIAPGQPSVDILLKTSRSTKVRSFLLTVSGTAKVAGRDVTRTAILTSEPGIPDLDTVRVAVALLTPFKVVGKYEMGWASRGSIGKRRYRIERNGFNGPLRVRLADRQARHLQGATGPEITVPAGVSEFEYPVTMPPWMEIGRTCRVCVMAVGVIKEADGSEHEVSFSSVNQNEQYVAVVEAGRLDVATGQASIRAEADKPVRVPIRVTRGKDLVGAVRVELVVPEHIHGIAAKPIVLPVDRATDALEITFSGARPGPFNMPLLVRATLLDAKYPAFAEVKIEVEASP